MTCLSIPTSPDAIEGLIALCAGTADWRPLFLLGLATAVGIAGLLLVGAFVLLIVWNR